MKENTKIFIAVPSMDQVPAHFAQSLAMLQKVGSCAVAFQIGSLIYTSRNELAKAAIKMGADYVMWFDSDMVFDGDTLRRLADDLDKGDIVTGLYFRRVAPYSPVLFSKLEISGDRCTWEELKELPKEDIFEVEGCGFGCVLMPTKILMDVSINYFDMFSPINGMGEDLSFCWRARQLGYKIICDQTIKLGHVGHYIVDHHFYENFNLARG